MNIIPTMNASIRDMDDSLRTERTFENAPTNRVKHVALSKRRELYKKQMGDVSQVLVPTFAEQSSSSSKQRLDSSVRSVNSDDHVRYGSGCGIKRGDGSVCSGSIDPLAASWHGGLNLDGLLSAVAAAPQDVPTKQTPPSPKDKKKGFVKERQRRKDRRLSTSDSSISIDSLFNDYDGPCPAKTSSCNHHNESSVDFGSTAVDASPCKKSSNGNRGKKEREETPAKKSNQKEVKKSKEACKSRRRASDATASTAPLYNSDPSLLFNSDPSLLGSPGLPPANNNNSTTPGEPKVTLRRKYQPRHRSMANGSVQSIVKPSRYTRSISTDTCTSSTTSSTTASSTRKAGFTVSSSPSNNAESSKQPFVRRRRRASLSDKPSRPQLSGSFTQLKPREITKLKNLRPDVIPLSSDDSSSSEEQGSLWNDEDTIVENMNSSMPCLGTTQNDSWVPHGVDFSSCMEVYVFEK